MMFVISKEFGMQCAIIAQGGQIFPATLKNTFKKWSR